MSPHNRIKILMLKKELIHIKKQSQVLRQLKIVKKERNYFRDTLITKSREKSTTGT